MLMPEEKFISLRRLNDYHTFLNQYKQNKLVSGVNLDTTPTADSDNPITSNAVYQVINGIKDGTTIDSFADVEMALSEKLNTADVDDALSGTSTNPVQNKAVQAPIARLVDAGAKNLINFTLEKAKANNTDGTWSGNVYTINGVNFTVNSNGTVSMSMVSGTTTHLRAVFWIDIEVPSSYTGIYIISGGNANAASNSFSLSAEETSSPWTNLGCDYGNNGAVIAQTSNATYGVYIGVKADYVISGTEIIKPMICTKPAWDISHEFEPYALSNADLTMTSLREIADFDENGNFDKQIQSGYYRYHGSPSNVPKTSSTYGLLLVIKHSNYISQIAHGFTDNRLYIRTSTDSIGSTFSSWYPIQNGSAVRTSNWAKTFTMSYANSYTRIYRIYITGGSPSSTSIFEVFGGNVVEINNTNIVTYVKDTSAQTITFTSSGTIYAAVTETIITNI